MAISRVALTLLAASPRTAAITCGTVKEWYRDNSCCGMPDKVVRPGPSGYDFVKPACDDAEPQSPRDLTDGAEGELTPKAATLNAAQAEFLPLVNVHYHLGAEHRSEAFQDQTDSDAYDGGRRLATGVRPGYMCAAVPTASDVNYTFKHCLGEVEVGKTYEVHYVHSSAGYAPEDIDDADVDGIEDGLGGAANGRGILNPMIVVQGQIYQIVPAEDGGETNDDLLHAWTVTDHTSAVMYAGSTTGQSHDNKVCSPYHITWHVDKQCHKITPESFDNLCKQMRDLYDMEYDLYPHGSRTIVDKKYVCKADYVTPYA
jgi:hypothetical protein